GRCHVRPRRRRRIPSRLRSGRRQDRAKTLAPLNVPDYAPYLAQIKPDLDGIYMGFAGSNPLRFLQQMDDYGLKGKIGVLGNTTSTDEGILKLMGDAAVDTFSAGWYAASLETAGTTN